jgi:glycosyltransferase involved in cell wall biosynthesis
LKIIHADTDDLDNPLHGGQPVRTYEVNSRLARQHDITVYTAAYPDCQRSVVQSGITYQRLGFYLPPLGLSPHLSFLASLGPQIKRTPHDLIIEEFTPPVGFCLLPLWTTKPVISIVQWYSFDFWERRYHLPFSRWMRKIASCHRYRYFIVQTEAMGKIFRSLIPDAVIREIPCGVDDSAFLESTSAADFVLYLGRLDRAEKGLDFLLNCWVKMCGPAGIPLVVAGEGPDRNWLETGIAAAGLGSAITLAGRVEGKRKNELLQACRFLVMPSRIETFGITALEAMAAAKPVVAFDIDHLNELVRPDWGALIPAYDENALGKAICRLWSDPDLCRSAGTRGKTAARKYRWHDIAQQQEEFYREVIKRETK